MGLGSWPSQLNGESAEVDTLGDPLAVIGSHAFRCRRRQYNVLGASLRCVLRDNATSCELGYPRTESIKGRNSHGQG